MSYANNCNPPPSVASICTQRVLCVRWSIRRTLEYSLTGQYPYYAVSAVRTYARTHTDRRATFPKLGHVFCQECVETLIARDQCCPYRDSLRLIEAEDTVPILFSPEAAIAPTLRVRIDRRLAVLSMEQQRVDKTLKRVAASTEIVSKHVCVQRASISRHYGSLDRITNEVRALQRKVGAVRAECVREYDAIIALRAKSAAQASSLRAEDATPQLGEQRRRQRSPSAANTEDAPSAKRRKT
ncbi:uncharacterized protein B0H18DRAFT_1123036 [Fomitopsis serialis]|uniref:uncharacterized protein n=1 Tax=Fomitopsis serialis TaxID=139415 RepID=UPI0020073427|nr:uncharacterized protein B0H18DRAFT_1123036 [Neoantrodia serialis]KAH9918431.1 hypothetical protein B0H18DRAFT_1123036 [Neoantrodia serialis]